MSVPAQCIFASCRYLQGVCTQEGRDLRERRGCQVRLTPTNLRRIAKHSVTAGLAQYRINDPMAQGETKHCVLVGMQDLWCSLCRDAICGHAGRVQTGR